ncbi:MAG TPA: ABC transporter permease [Nocardioidaceae bacterium]|nr:ABC transporter permease [Nocardioidaceae bacterium]
MTLGIPYVLGLPYGQWLSEHRAEVIGHVQEHILLAVYTIIIASVLGLLISLAVYRRVSISTVTISLAATGFTLPSVALFGILFSLVGGSLLAIFPPLVLYALLPIVRNSIVGLQNVDPNILDAARGMGMGRFRMLWQIELPMAWPVIVAGLRVSTQLTVGIVTIAAFVKGIGMGVYAFDALDNLGSTNTGNEAITCVIFVIAIALVFDAIWVVIRRLTTPRGSHA